MNTKSKTGQEHNKQIDDLFTFQSEKIEVEHEARMIMFRFLSEIERLGGNERGFKKRLAKAINKTSSYITQLYSGTKLINLITLAKFQKELDIKFKITAYRSEDFDMISSPTDEMITNIFITNEVYSRIEPKDLYADAIRKYADLVQVTPKSELHKA